jgi:hypothetical protein
LEDRGVDGWDLNRSWGDWLEGLEWIKLAQDRGWWQALVNAVMKNVVNPAADYAMIS